MSNNIYNILGKLKTLTESAEPAAPEATVYETVEARGSISEAVKSLEGKYAAFKEAKDEYKCILPDGSDDVLFTGTKAECEAWASKGDKDVKIVKEAKKAKPDFLDVDKDGDKKEPFKKAVKDKKAVKEGQEEWYDKDGNVDPNGAYDAAGHYYLEREVNEGQGPYTLDDPKHPKFKANFEKFKKKNPDAKLADFVAAMRKKEKGLAEGQSVSRKSADFTTWVLQQGDKFKDFTKNPDTYAAAQKAYKADKQVKEGAFDYEDDNVDYSEFRKAQPANPDTSAIAKRKRLQAIKDRQEEQGNDYNDTKSNVRKVAGKAYGGAAQKDDEEKDLDEVAPPGAKAERMVKHIKKGYADDGKLTKREKGIAYATAWKAKKAGNLEEATEFGDTIKNSAATMKKAKLAKLKESRVMEETDYFYEKVGKALAGKNPNLDTAGSDFVAAVRKEMIAQGIEPNRARNILMMDEDFLSDVATSYDHCCKEMQPEGILPNAPLDDSARELDEIASLAGLSSPMEMAPAYNVTAQDDEDERRLEHYNELISAGVDPDDAEVMAFNDEGDEELAEDDMAEGNEFSGALAAAKAKGEKEFEVDGKRYTVKEDINVSITANGQEDALNLFRKLAGMDEVEPTVTTIAVPQDAESAIAQGVVEPVDEERDIEYVNTPNEKIAPISASIPNGTDLHRSKMQDPETANKAANPLRKEQQVEENLWKSYESMLADVKAK